MRRGYLSEHFKGVGAKRLSAVEASAERSRQHEFNGSRSLETLLGTPQGRQEFATRFLRISDEGEPASAEGTLTWYDARERHPSRSELRLYYTANDVTRLMQEGDLLVVALRQDGTLLAVIAEGGSSIEEQIEWLFGLDSPESEFEVVHEASFDQSRLQLAARIVLESIGISALEDDERALEMMLERFNGRFPSTAEFSAFARELSERTRFAESEIDEVLVTWLEKEETLFMTLERHIVKSRIEAGFRDVDDFMDYSLSVQNRRKARAGRSLENHLEMIFSTLRLSHTRGARTEGRSTPDFLFPGISEYRNGSFPTDRLTMLAAKSTCKDRWRQILTEAQRIRDKHLITLEPGITSHQTGEMSAAGVHLVVPAALHDTYRPAQRGRLMTLSDFVDMVRVRQLVD
jgi:hypothetical protein